ncbi:alpha-glucan family phosphorylase [Agromyces sp. Soil535]|uniref:alpha-glucan family phosphorylase n=1 Tax=Agromyces sp. Soil535 TaxID=1736390 RepID=UPI0007005852|nr:alpha-glucan family phosphorylase [Agromyces sp. Soil535]KRE30246.1 glycogen phosphorylase [Agromyces sp. Soil535]
MKPIRKFTVRAVVPGSLSALEELAGNLRWSWHEPTKRLFEHIDPELWRSSRRDPVAFLGEVDPARLDELAADGGYVEWAERERAGLREYLSEPRWFQSLGADAPRTVAYFSPEFGITAALPQYSGGLGILAGDHLKAASDLGVPLVGVGLFYKAGYFAQSISPDGWQQERYPVLDPDGLPLSVLRRPDGSPVQVTLALPDDQSLHARVWKAAVGRITLLMLDTDIPANPDELRSVTDRLYGGGGEHRLLQELLLGIGGARAVRAFTELGGSPAPDVFHMNEGHAGFLGLERIATHIAEGLSFAEALQLVRAGTVFTTHTPVPAGIDRFDRPLVERYLTSSLLPGVDPADALALGVEPGADPATSPFNMAVMGLRLAQRANGVSKLHGQVSRRMFGNLWPGFDADDVPITSITNGVHAPTWTDPALRGLAESILGTGDTEHADWTSAALSDAEFWGVKRRMRLQLVQDARRRLASAWTDQHPGMQAPPWVSRVLDPDTLTVGFARRVPTYKRLTLMLRDPERLKAILTNPERPVQFVIAGKSHPADDEGKRLIQQLVQFAQQPELRERIVFLPDYDMGMAEMLYPGCDVWLNNPLRPLEACGTSGMKAAMNGALNLSILDGWWAEYAGDDYGWVIPSADAAGDAGERDTLEAAALYELLEHRVATRYYERDADGVPLEWVRRVRTTLSTLAPELGADRMVKQYVEELYRPAAEQAARVEADGDRGARALAAFDARVRRSWPKVQVVHVESGGVESPHVGDELGLRAYVELDGLAPDDVTVEVVYGRSRADETIEGVRRTALSPDPAAAAADAASGPHGPRLYTGTVVLDRAGAFGYTVRVVPRHPLLVSPAELGLVAVAG